MFNNYFASIKPLLAVNSKVANPAANFDWAQNSLVAQFTFNSPTMVV